ncbi:MAG: tetratricopeptide repeat protein, partial [Verrucomicrobiota bacterium]
MKQFKGIFASIIVSMAILFLASEAIADDAAKARKAAQQANQYASQGEYKKALSPAFTFLKITKKNLGEDHIITSYGYQRLATLYLNLGEFDQAKNYLYLTKKHQSKHWGQKSLQLAPVYQLYGDFYALQNMPDKAIDHYKIAAYRYSKLGHKDGKIAQVTCLYYIAGVALAQSDFDDAYNYIQQAIKIIKAHIGSNSLEFAELTNMKAQVELVRENVNGALSSIKESIQILQKRNKTAEKLKLAEYYMGLASIHLVKGDTELAIEALKNIKDLTEDDAPASKRLRIKSLATLAVSYRQSDLARSGVMCLEEASALFKTLPPRQEEAFYEGFLQEMISACYVDLEDAEKAQYYLNSALEIYRDQLGPTNIGTIRTENALALILQKRNKHKEAIEIVERICHTLYEMPYDENFTYEHSYMLKASLYNHAISLENLQSH